MSDFSERNRRFSMSLTDVQMAYIEAERIVSDLQSENAKLRELADYMTPIAWYAASEQERDRMRELGVEVDA